MVYLLGGPAALAEDVATAVAADGFTPVRLAGPSRVETALAIADAVTRGSGTVAVARAFGNTEDPTAGWADAVTAGPWAAASGTPILLTPATTCTRP